MNKIVLTFLLYISCITAFCQSISEFDSLLHAPGLYLVAYPDDGPKEALKGLKPLFCNDKEVIRTFFHALELSIDTSCTGRAYYNYIIHFRSDSIKLDKWIGCSFYPDQSGIGILMNAGKNEYYSFNTKSISYLKSHSSIIKQQIYTPATLQQARIFYTFLIQEPETYFHASIQNDSAYLKYDGSVLVQFEFSKEMGYEEGEKIIQDKIAHITGSSNYYYQMVEAHWEKAGFTTEKIVLYINKKDLLESAKAYTIQDWRPYEPISFTVLSNRINVIDTYYLNMSK